MAGLRYARHDAVVGPVLLAMFVVGFAGFNFPMVMPLMAKFVYHVNEKKLSVPISFSAAGSLLSGILAARLTKPSMKMLGVSSLIFGVVLGIYGAAPTYYWWVVVAFPVGYTAALYTTMVVQVLQKSSRPEMVGRVMALYGIAFFGTTPIGAVFVALLSDHVSVRAPFIIGGVIVGITGLVTLVKFGRVGFTVARAEIGDRAAII